MKEFRAIFCNYTKGTGIAAESAKCVLLSYGNVVGRDNRVIVLARSRGGRWVKKWETLKRLGNFRVKTVVESDPLYKVSYDRLYYTDEYSNLTEDCKALNGIAESVAK